MKKQWIVVVMTVGMLSIIGRAGDDVGAQKMKRLYECGIGTENGFNGWMLNGLPEEANTYFERDHLEIFKYQAGNYSVGLTRKVEDMVGYSEIAVAADIEAVENCILNHVTAYVSRDGKHWEAFQQDARRGARIENDQMNYLFVKLVADVQLFPQARFRFNKFSLFGDYKTQKVKRTSAAKRKRLWFER